MRKRSFIIITLLMLLVNAGHAQKILLKMDGVTATDGEPVTAVDFKIEGGAVGAGGTGGGKPTVGNFNIKKTNGTSTNKLFKAVLGGQHFTSAKIEYYDVNNKLYFSTTLFDVTIANMYWLSPECPTCIKMEHQIGFGFSKIENFDAGTGITTGFVISTGTFY